MVIKIKNNLSSETKLIHEEDFDFYQKKGWVVDESTDSTENVPTHKKGKKRSKE